MAAHSSIHNSFMYQLFLTKMGIRIFPIPTTSKDAYNLILMVFTHIYYSNSVIFALIYRSENIILAQARPYVLSIYWFHLYTLPVFQKLNYYLTKLRLYSLP